nr:MAG TPA: hypothetical protein [Caudoviricetes sp.]
MLALNSIVSFLKVLPVFIARLFAYTSPELYFRLKAPSPAAKTLFMEPSPLALRIVNCPLMFGTPADKVFTVSPPFFVPAVRWG